MDRHHDNPMPGEAQQRRHEAMHAFVGRPGLETRAAHDPQAAGAIDDVLVRDPIADGIRHARGDALEPRVVANQPRADGGVGAVQVLQQDLEIGGIVLQVAVHGRQDLATRGTESRDEGRRQAGLPLEAQQAHPRVALDEAAEDIRAGVRRSVVDEDDLDRPAQPREDRQQFVPEHRQAVRLVVHGEHDREGRPRAHRRLAHRFRPSARAADSGRTRRRTSAAPRESCGDSDGRPHAR